MTWKPPPLVDLATLPASKASETSVPTQPFQPNPPHSQPPSGEGPNAKPAPLVPRRGGGNFAPAWPFGIEAAEADAEVAVAAARAADPAAGDADIGSRAVAGATAHP